MKTIQTTQSSRDRLRRIGFVSIALVMAALVATAMPAKAATVSIAWSSASDWDAATTEDSVVHESTQYTDYDNASNVRLGYSPSDPLYNNSLVAYYPLQEDSGSTAYDFSGNNNDGAINGSTTNQTGLLGTSAYSFDGTDDEIDIISNSSGSNYLNGTSSKFTEYTVSAWVKASPTGHPTDIISILNNNGAIQLQSDDGSGNYRLHHTDGGSYWRGITASPNYGEWQLLTGVYNGSSIILYVNGSKVASKSISGLGTNSDSYGVELGSGADPGYENRYDGKMADVRIYDRALSDSEVKKLYNVTKGYIQTKSKTFSTAVKPDLKSSADLNGQDINVTVTGSPSTTASESHTVALDGSGGPYSIPWASPHTEFEINASLSTSNITKTPILQSLSLTTTLYNVSGTVSGSGGAAISGATVEAINSSSGNVIAQDTTNSSSPNYALVVPNGTYTIKGYKKGYQNASTSLTVDGSDVSNLDITLNDSAPQYSNPSPINTTLSSLDATLSINVSDPDFGAVGDNVSAEIYYDGSLVSKQNLTSNGTVSYTISNITAGNHTWHARLEDITGNTNKTPTYNIGAPDKLYIREENNPSSLVDNANVTIRFFGESSVYVRETSDGVVNLTGLPADQVLVATVSSAGYYNRRIPIRSLIQQQTVYLLNKTETSVAPTFVLRDYTGKYDPENTIMFIQRPINGSWETVEGDFFGATGKFESELQYNIQHRLVVENVVTGDRRILGRYTPTTSNRQLVEITPTGSKISRKDVSIQVEPGVSVSARNGTKIGAEIHSDTGSLSSYNVTATVDGALLFSQTGSNSTGERIVEPVNLSGYAGESINVEISYELDDGTASTVSKSIAIRENFANEYSLLSVLGKIPGRADPGTAGVFTTVLAVFGTILGTAAIAKVIPASTESVGLVAVGWVGVFSLIGWVGLELLFIAAISWTVLAGLRRGL